MQGIAGDGRRRHQRFVRAVLVLNIVLITIISEGRRFMVLGSTDSRSTTPGCRPNDNQADALGRIYRDKRDPVHEDVGRNGRIPSTTQPMPC